MTLFRWWPWRLRHSLRCYVWYFFLYISPRRSSFVFVCAKSETTSRRVFVRSVVRPCDTQKTVMVFNFLSLSLLHTNTPSVSIVVVPSLFTWWKRTLLQFPSRLPHLTSWRVQNNAITNVHFILRRCENSFLCPFNGSRRRHTLTCM